METTGMSGRAEHGDDIYTSHRETEKKSHAPANENDRKICQTSKSPFVFFRAVTSYPITAFCLSFGFHILVIIISGWMMAMGYDLFPTNFVGLPLELYSNPYRTRDYAFRDRDKFENIFVRELPNSGYPLLERGLLSINASITLYYDTTEGNIFTKEHFQKIQEIEDDIISTHGYTSSFCLTVDIALACAKPKSILRYFDGTYRNINPIFYDPNFLNIQDVLYEAFTNNVTMYDFKYFLPKTYILSKFSAKASILRTFIPFGCSFNGSTSCDAMKTLWDDFLTGQIKAKLEKWRRCISQFDFFYHSFELWFKDFTKQAFMDMVLVIGSISFIFAFMVFHTRSLWIACLAVVSIVSSFAGTNIIYRYVLGYRYFGLFHILIMFIILGIGADDLFVFYDTWRLTRFQTYPTVAHRLSYVFSKSALSMLITSVTTMAAFLCSALSPLMVMRTFGIFAGILVVYNYISVIIFFPTVVVTFHFKFAYFKWPCLPKFGKNRSKSKTIQPNMNRPKVWVTTRSACKLSENSSQLHMKQKRHKRLVVFFRDHYFRFITHKVLRWLILCLCIAVFVFSGRQIANLESENEVIRLYKAGHFYQKAADAEQDSFLVKTSQNLLTIYIAWGLRQKNRDRCHFSAIDCNGDNEYDDEFDPNPVRNQQALIDFCNILTSFDENQIKEYRIKQDPASGLAEIACFTKDLNYFMANKGLSLGMDLSLPWNYSTLQEFLKQETTHYDPSKINSTFPNTLEIPTQYWLYNGYIMNNTKDYRTYNKLFGEEISDWSQKLKSHPNVKYGNRLKYIAIEINTTINKYAIGYTEGIPLIKKWEKLVSDQVSKMPVGLKGGFQLAEDTWHWMFVQRSMVDSAVLGLVTGVSLAFLILTLATMNIIIGFLSTFCITCTTVSVIGVIPLIGWKFGLLVSLNICMLVGLAVDYVVHLAEGYHLSKNKDRLSRTRDMLTEMAMSVFSGACTTLGASMFMFFAQIQFCMQFGIFLFCTVGFSIFYSLGLFCVLMGLFGPENDTGCLKTIANNFVKKVRKSCIKQ